MNEDWLDELQENVKIGIYVTLRLLEKERSGSKLTWKYLSERLYQAAHLRSREEPFVSSEELWVVKGKAPERGLLREVRRHLYELQDVFESSFSVCNIIVASNSPRKRQRTRSHFKGALSS